MKLILEKLPLNLGIDADLQQNIIGTIQAIDHATCQTSFSANTESEFDEDSSLKVALLSKSFLISSEDFPRVSGTKKRMTRVPEMNKFKLKTLAACLCGSVKLGSF